jgi:hypothetical protein
VSFLQPQYDCGGSISRKFVASFICAFGSALLLFSSSIHGKQNLPLLELNVDSQVATSGYYRLNWDWRTESPGNFSQFELDESKDDDFTDKVVFYRGPDLATVVSGKSNGTLYYRIVALDAQDNILATSNPVKVQIQHHSLSRALLFFGLGAVVFLFTLVVVLRGQSPEVQQ